MGRSVEIVRSSEVGADRAVVWDVVGLVVGRIFDHRHRRLVARFGTRRP